VPRSVSWLRGVWRRGLRSRRPRALALVVAASLALPVLALLVAACDETPGADALSTPTPRLADLVLTPRVVRVGDPDVVVRDDSVDVTLGVRLDVFPAARADDGVVRLDTLFITLQSTRLGLQAVFTDLGAVTGPTELRLPPLGLRLDATTAQAFDVSAFALDADGAASNEVTTVLRIEPAEAASGSSVP
jgi:hypothetical protein